MQGEHRRASCSLSSAGEAVKGPEVSIFGYPSRKYAF